MHSESDFNFENKKMVKIKLSRTGRKNYATYRLIVTEARSKLVSKPIEFIGHYNPHTKDLEVKKERAEYWLSVGAQPSDTIERLFVKAGVLKVVNKNGKKFSKKPGKKAVERAEAKSAKEEAKKPSVEEKSAEETKEEIEKSEESEVKAEEKK